MRDLQGFVIDGPDELRKVVLSEAKRDFCHRSATRGIYRRIDLFSVALYVEVALKGLDNL